MTGDNGNDALGNVRDDGTLIFERDLPGPLERVWEYITDADKRATWLAGGEFDLRAGGEARLSFRLDELTGEPVPERYGTVQHHEHICRITRCEPPHVLAFTWPEGGGAESEVTFELEPREDSVLLRLTHRRLPDRETEIDVASGWHAHLGLLADRLSARPPRGFWSAHAAAEARYEQIVPAR